MLLYRLQYGTQPQNPNGPRFLLIGSPSPARQTYTLLREGVDYYMDPSLLWFALVRPLNPNNERLVVAYNVRINGRDTVWATTGGTPDVQAAATPQYANLVWDPSVNPDAPAFDREIRSVYRVGGEDLDRRSVQLRVFAGTGDQERPLVGQAQTYLQMFGLAELNNSETFDVENRLWPRPTDPNVSLNAGAGDPRLAGSTKIIHDYFLVMPSLRPFAARDSGLVAVGQSEQRRDLHHARRLPRVVEPAPGVGVPACTSSTRRATTPSRGRSCSARCRSGAIRSASCSTACR